MKTFKQFSLIFLSVFALFYGAIAMLCVALYVYDPFLFFHAPIYRAKTFLGNSQHMRTAMPGIISYTDFENVIAGSSMLEKTLSNEAEFKLGGKWVNLSTPSLSFFERDILFHFLFQKKNIQSVIYALESYYLLNDSIKDYEEKGKNALNPKLFNGGGVSLCC